ncbi:MAG: hypothetical protein PF541_12095 [Prolixibacteraceae bacterium]|jgi:hypothetical protein|nr:hypothetical protein [Prolixibacteraceae bacterium]
MKIITLILFLISISTLAKPPLKIGFSTGGGFYNITSKQIFYDPDPAGSLYNFMGIDKDGGKTIFIEGDLTYNLNRNIDLRTGLNLGYRNGFFTERRSDSEETQFNFFYTGIPIEAIFFPQHKWSFVTGIETNLLLASGDFNERLLWWANTIYHSYGIEKDLKLNLLNIKASAGIALHIWVVDLELSYYHAILPILSLHSPKPTVATYDGDFKGRLDFYYSGFEVKLKVPIRKL